MANGKFNNSNISQIDKFNFSWVNVTKPAKKQLEEVQKRFGFLDVDMRDCLPPLQRPKLVERPGYLFMVLIFPVYNRSTGKIVSSEIDFFISGNYLITIHDNELVPLKDFYKECQENKKTQNLFKNPAGLLVELLTRLLKYCYPMIIHIGQDIDNIEEKVFEVHNSKATFEILRIKINIVEFRDGTDLHEGVIKKLISKSSRFMDTSKLDEYLQMLVEHTVEIKDRLQTYANTIDAIDSTHQSLINLRANQIMKNLQIFAVIVFPLTLLAAVFGMNIVGGMPFVGHAYGFWIILIIMLGGTFGMLWFFRLKKWL